MLDSARLYIYKRVRNHVCTGASTWRQARHISRFQEKRNTIPTRFWNRKSLPPPPRKVMMEKTWLESIEVSVKECIYAPHFHAKKKSSGAVHLIYKTPPNLNYTVYRPRRRASRLFLFYFYFYWRGGVDLG